MTDRLFRVMPSSAPFKIAIMTPAPRFGM